MGYMLDAALLLLQSAPAGGNALLSGILPILLIFGIFYFLFFLPDATPAETDGNRCWRVFRTGKCGDQSAASSAPSSPWIVMIR